MKLTLTQLGTPKDVQTKYGLKQKNYAKATEYADKFLSFWVSSQTSGWKVGDVVEVQDVTDRDYQGKKYHDIVMPKTTQSTDPALMGKIILNLGNIERKLDQVIKHLSNEQRLDLTSDGTKVPDFTEVDELNNPF